MATDSTGILPYRPAPCRPRWLGGSAGQMGDAFRARKHKRGMGRTGRGEPGADEKPLAAAVRVPRTASRALTSASGWALRVPKLGYGR